MLSINSNTYTRGSFPNPYRFIKASTGNVPTIRRPYYRSYSIAMLIVGLDDMSQGYIPDVYTSISTRGGNAHSIRRPCYSLYNVCIATLGEIKTLHRIPVVERLIIPSRSYKSIIRVPAYSRNSIGL